MNAPLPVNVARDGPGAAYETVARAGNEVAAQLARRLAAETRGDVLFSAADRGRYATDASIYQVVPVGVFVPRTSDDVKLALDICRDLQVPIVPRGGGTSQCGQTVGAGLVIDHSRHVRNILQFDAGRRTAEVEPGIVLDHLNAALQEVGPVVPGGRLHQRAGDAGRHGGQQLLRQPQHRLRQHGAQRAGRAGLDRGRRAAPLRALRRDASAARAGSADGCRSWRCTLAPEIDRRWPKVLRRVGGYNLDIFHNQNERPYTADGSVNLAHLLVGSEGTLAVTKSLTLSSRSCPAPRCWAS